MQIRYHRLISMQIKPCGFLCMHVSFQAWTGQQVACVLLYEPVVAVKLALVSDVPDISSASA